MTTIACNLQEMSADSLVSDEYVGTGEYASRKLHRIGDSIFGESGENCEEIGLAIEWFKRGQIPDERPEFTEDADFIILELSRKGIFVWNKFLVPTFIDERFMAIGSGRKVALYCMKHLKMPPEQAVLESSKVDRYTKPPIHTEKL